jgi:hypothetical protein
VLLVLLVVGAALELGGLGLVAWDVLAAKRQRAVFSLRNQLVQVPGIASERAIGGVTVHGGVQPGDLPAPTLDERVEQLERDAESVQRSLAAIDEREERNHDALLDRVGGLVAEARRETFELREELRPLIGHTVAGSIGRRWLGVALFALGLVVQTVANVAALFAA